MSAQLFPLGFVCSTPAALRTMALAGVDPADLLTRHATGDWGDLGPDDKAANQRALTEGTRLLSAYDLPGGGRVWIITEHDRSVSTFMLPREY